uniref:Uncharacterized protein n=1 Tax=Aegilops tauschii subsp. strangulata TaxID=200361 RepID=A0A453KX07_AEGTS
RGGVNNTTTTPSMVHTPRHHHHCRLLLPPSISPSLIAAAAFKPPPHQPNRASLFPCCRCVLLVGFFVRALLPAASLSRRPGVPRKCMGRRRKHPA